MVTAVIVATFQRSRLRHIKESQRTTFGVLHQFARTIQGMASRVEPGIAVTATVNAVELEGGATHHGIHLLAHDKGARDIVPDLDTQTGVRRDIARNMTDLDNAGLPRDVELVTLLVVSSRIGTGDNRPVRRSLHTTTGERTRHRRAQGITVDINHFESGRRSHIVELLFGVARQVTGLVDTDRRHAIVDCIEVRLVQRIGNKGIRHIRGRGTVLRHHIVFHGDRRVIMIKDSRIPGEGPHRTNQVIRRGLFLTRCRHNGYGRHRDKHRSDKTLFNRHKSLLLYTTKWRMHKHPLSKRPNTHSKNRFISLKTDYPKSENVRILLSKKAKKIDLEHAVSYKSF